MREFLSTSLRFDVRYAIYAMLSEPFQTIQSRS